MFYVGQRQRCSTFLNTIYYLALTIETSLSAIVQELKCMKSAAGPSYFTFEGEPLVDIANRTQWKDYK